MPIGQSFDSCDDALNDNSGCLLKSTMRLFGAENKIFENIIMC